VCRALRLAQQIRQLGDIRRDPARKQPELLDGDVCNWALVQIFSMSS
jgi:hypothetical protein